MHVVWQALQAYMKDAMASLNRKVADLDDVRLVMATLKEVGQEPDQAKSSDGTATSLSAACVALDRMYEGAHAH